MGTLFELLRKIINVLFWVYVGVCVVTIPLLAGYSFIRIGELFVVIYPPLAIWNHLAKKKRKQWLQAQQGTTTPDDKLTTVPPAQGINSTEMDQYKLHVG